MARIFFILGCTACGKGAVGRVLARRLGGQIVSVDSMKVYRRMDIGTGKPSLADRAEISHHCIDIVEPSESFSVARYVEFADRAVDDISTAGDVVLAVGGTALYLKSLSEGLFEGPGADAEIRGELKRRAAAEGLAVLHDELTRIDPESAGRIHPNDEKRIVRALEVYLLTGEPISRLQRQWDKPARRYDCLFIGLRRSREDTNWRINARVRRMIEQGLRDEVAALLDEPAGLSHQAAQALGYAEMIEHLEGKLSLDEAVEQIKINTRQFAKRQRTWFRRFRDVRWIDAAEDATAEDIAEKAINYFESGV
ncbi:MAG: tRNA (adenosine(37)-N6)-dimethylallyltransferase MiaA [Planctomycetota bacterium]|nr:tRNA (adenosine(37)-N6)-dimethylallyltransferase MiaA [Planctomycetota bacterium]